MACETGPETAVVTRDSAGVSITFSNRPAWEPGQGWRVAPDPATDTVILYDLSLGRITDFPLQRGAATLRPGPPTRSAAPASGRDGTPAGPG